MVAELPVIVTSQKLTLISGQWEDQLTNLDADIKSFEGPKDKWRCRWGRLGLRARGENFVQL
jgi:hypothetical protein